MSWLGDRLSVTAASMGALRSLASGLPGDDPSGVPGADPSGHRSTACGLDLTVTGWKPPWPTWSGRIGHLPGLVRHEVILPKGGRGTATVRLTLTEPVPLWSIVAAVLAVLEPGRPLPAPVSCDVAFGGGAPRWLRPDARSAVLASEGTSDEVVRPYDVRVTTSEQGGYGQALLASPYGVIGESGTGTVVVDAIAANPRRRQRFGPELPAGKLTYVSAPGGVWWQIGRAGDESAIVVAGRAGDPLDPRQSAALVQLGLVQLGVVEAEDSPAGVPPAAQAATLAQLAMTGVVLHLPALPPAVDGLLSPDVAAIVRTPLPGPAADPLEWELRSVAQRRSALRHHAAAFALPRATSSYPSLSRPPAVTALLVSRRPRLVQTAVAAMAAQSYPELEIVVGLHGCELPAADRDRLTGHGVAVRVVDIRAELCFGEALGEATRWAQGSLITKVDDDDRYGPEHVWDLVLARHYSGAVVAGKGAEFVYLEQRDLTVRRRMGRELYTDVVAGGTMLLSRGDLEAVGGWRPLDRSADRGLLDRVLGDGGLVYRTHSLGFIYTRHGDGHTWDPGLDYFLNDPLQRWSGLPPHDEFGAR